MIPEADHDDNLNAKGKTNCMIKLSAGPTAFLWFARHGRILTGESPECA